MCCSKEVPVREEEEGIPIFLLLIPIKEKFSWPKSAVEAELVPIQNLISMMDVRD